MSSKKSLLVKSSLVGLAVLIPTATALFWPLATHNSPLVPNMELLKGKQVYLSQKWNSESQINKANKPNVIVILADDLGKYDISLYGGKDVPTPHIDSLAHSGVTFNSGYVSAPISAPSRAGLLTGRYQERFGFEVQTGDRYPRNYFEYLGFKYLLPTGEWRINAHQKYPGLNQIQTQGLPLSEITFADIAKTQGYATAAIGKWHLGASKGYFPTDRGFDTHFGFYQAFSLYAPEDAPQIINHHHQDFTDKFIWGSGQREGLTLIRRDSTVIDEKHYLTEKFAQEAEQFIEKNKAKPFLLYLPFNAPHTPFQVTPEYYNRFAHVKDTNKRVYYAMISALDDAVGRIVQKVRAEGLEENTLIVFASDNGGATYTHATTNAPLKGGKFSHFEGGINVPFFLSWKGKIKANTQYDYPISTLDITSTIAANIGATLPTDRPYDGVDLVKAVNSQSEAHKALYWKSGRAKAIRSGDWKYILSAINGKEWLYNLKEDKFEKNNLLSQNPQKVLELKNALAEWEKQLAQPLWPSLTHFEFDFGNEKYYVDL